MEVKIGVVYTPRELVIEVGDDVQQTVDAIDAALREGSPVLWLTDTKGRRVAVPTGKIAYVEVGADVGDRQVGFGNR